jgi:hypothetical protein
MICSLNQSFARCHSEVDFHTNNTKVSNNVNSSLMKSLTQYEKENGQMPERLCFYSGDPHVIMHGVHSLNQPHCDRFDLLIRIAL